MHTLWNKDKISVRAGQKIPFYPKTVDSCIEAIKNSDLKSLSVSIYGKRLIRNHYKLFLRTKVANTLTNFTLLCTLQENIVFLCKTFNVYAKVLENVDILVYVTDLPTCFSRGLIQACQQLARFPRVKIGNFGTNQEVWLSLKQLRKNNYSKLQVTWFYSAARDKILSEKIVVTNFIQLNPSSIEYYTQNECITHAKCISF